eukprot:scaffold136691_cov316-Phaeocystis_antarctica.AAC.1
MPTGRGHQLVRAPPRGRARGRTMGVDSSVIKHSRIQHRSLPRITIDARDDGRLAVGAGGLRLALGGGVGVQGSARPQVGAVGDEGHAARDDEL